MWDRFENSPEWAELQRVLKEKQVQLALRACNGQETNFENYLETVGWIKALEYFLRLPSKLRKDEEDKKKS